MTTQEIITRFELQVDDSSELSSAEELALAIEVYNDISNDRPWEWLKTTATGTTSILVNYIALPVDFREMSQNLENQSVVFVGTDYEIYKVIPFSSRRNYREQDGFCYIDIPNQRLVFTKQPTEAKVIEYDYIANPVDLTVTTSPIFNAKFHNIISYGMAGKFNPIEQTEKDKSYQNENQIEYYKLLTDMRFEDSNLKIST